jgi:putative ABC transport system substrate-binding protein
MRRRTFIAGLGYAAAWPLAAKAQQPVMPVVAAIATGGAREGRLTAFRKGLGEAGYVDGQNVVVEYHGLGGQLDACRR